MPESVSDTEAMQIATAYIDAWNKRDRDAWLDLHHPDLELRPTALVGTGVVYRGIDGAAQVKDRKLVYTSGHFSDARTLASIGAIPEETTPLS